MNGQTSPSAGLTGQTKILLGLVGVFALVGLVVRFAASSPPASPGAADLGSAAGASAKPTPTVPAGAVVISIMTTNTKAEWLKAVTEEFNSGQNVTAAGHPIHVEMLELGGPEEFENNLLDGNKLKPVLVSPGDMSFIEKANQIRKDRGEREIPTEDCPPIARIPTGFAMWRPMAEAMGWPGKPIGWKDLVALAGDPQGWARYGHPEWGRFTFGHSHPVQSTSGFNVLASLAYAAAGKTQGLTPEDVRSERVVDAFRKVEKETFHYGLSTSKLLNLMAANGQGYLHAATTSETAFLWAMRHQADSLPQPWAFIFPAEGTFWSDNPTCILEESWVSEEQREAAKIYRDFLLSPAAQDKAIEIGIRPATPAINMRCPICLEMGTIPDVTPKTVPALASVSGETNAAIIDVFKETKKKATIALLLDVSSSMRGDAMENAIEGTIGFLGELHPDDEIEAYVFSDQVTPLQPSGRVGEVVEQLSDTVSTLYADGNTKLYDSICMAVDKIEALRQEDEAAGESRLYAVVVLSDGEDTNSKRSENEMFACLPSGEDVQEVKVYTIAYGKTADKDLLKRVANRTNGRSYEGSPQNIGQTYLDISAEQ